MGRNDDGIIDLSEQTHNELVRALCYSVYGAGGPPDLKAMGYEEKIHQGESDDGHQDWYMKAFGDDAADREKAWEDIGITGPKESLQVAALVGLVGDKLAVSLYETMLEKLRHSHSHNANNHKY